MHQFSNDTWIKLPCQWSQRCSHVDIAAPNLLSANIWLDNVKMGVVQGLGSALRDKRLRIRNVYKFLHVEDPLLYPFVAMNQLYFASQMRLIGSRYLTARI